MSHPPRQRWALPALALFLAACAASPNPEFSVAPTSTPTRVATSPDGDPNDLAGLVWLWISTREVNDVARSAEVALVRADGSVAWSTELAIDMELPRGGVLIEGPHAGRLVVGRLTEAGTQISVADAASGTDQEVAVITEEVLGTALDPVGETLYLLLGGASSGIHQLSLEPGASPELIAETAVDEVGEPGLSEDLLRLSPDGRILLVEACSIDAECLWSAIDSATGDRRRLTPVGAGSAIAVSNDLVLARAAMCVTGPCAFALVDLASGESRAWDPGAHNARLIVDVAGRSVLAYDTLGVLGAEATTEVVVVDPSTLAERPLRAIGDPGLLLGLARDVQDAWRPPGWLVLAPSGSNLGEVIGPILVSVADGRAVSLPMPAGR